MSYNCSGNDQIYADITKQYSNNYNCDDMRQYHIPI